MAKERSFNPTQAHHKAEKAKAIRKGKAEIQSKRNEKIARRNPNRIQRQINDLEAIVSSGGALSKSEEQALEALQKDLRSVNKAREALGDKAPAFGGSKGNGGVLGKRRRWDDHDEDDSMEDEDVAEDVKNIPMPRDTPPPIPRETMDRWWARRRARRNTEQEPHNVGSGQQRAQNTKHGDGGGEEFRSEGGDSGKPTGAPDAGPEPKTVYSSQPVLRDLRKEAVAFVPAAVRMKMVGSTEPATTDQQNSSDGTPREPGLASRRSRQVEVEDMDDVDG